MINYKNAHVSNITPLVALFSVGRKTECVLPNIFRSLLQESFRASTLYPFHLFEGSLCLPTG